MSLEASIKTTLAGIAGGRVYPDTTPDNPTFPLVIYQDVGGDVLNPLDGSDPGLDNARVQFTVWAKTRVEAKAIFRQVRLALTADLDAVMLHAPVSEVNDALKIRGSRSDFSVWYEP